MKRIVLLSVFVSACSTGSPLPPSGAVVPPRAQIPGVQADATPGAGAEPANPGADPAPASPGTAPASPGEDPAPGGCAYSEGIEPEAPAAPTDYCLAEYLDVSGIGVARTMRTVSHEGSLETVVSETFDAGDTLVARAIRETDGNRVLYESQERLDMPADATLPYTYGVAATWAVTRTYDAAGHMLSEAWDQAIDGVVDAEQRWTYAGDTVVEHLTMNDGKVTFTETFDEEGNPIERMDYGGYGTVWVYGDDGLLVREETVAKGAVTDYVAWTMASPDMALEAAVYHVHAASGTPADEQTGGTTWTWEDGALVAQDGWRIVYGQKRTTHIELDADGRQVVYVEETEQPDCHRYEQVTTYAGDALLDQMTTCDGALFEHRWSVFDTAGRIARVERIFIGNPTWTIHEVDTYEWDACGALTLREHSWNGALTMRNALVWDPSGRLIEKRIVSSQGGEEHIVPYEYDEQGRVTTIGEQHWTRDAEGRIIRAVGSESGPLAPPNGAPVASIEYSYCD